MFAKQIQFLQPQKAKLWCWGNTIQNVKQKEWPRSGTLSGPRNEPSKKIPKKSWAKIEHDRTKW